MTVTAPVRRSLLGDVVEGGAAHVDVPPGPLQVVGAVQHGAQAPLPLSFSIRLHCIATSATSAIPIFSRLPPGSPICGEPKTSNNCDGDE